MWLESEGLAGNRPSAAVTAARLAAQFARTLQGESATIEELALHATTAAEAAQRVREAVAQQRDPAEPLAVVAEIAGRYDSCVVASLDPDGMCVGLRFAGGYYTSGFSNTFFVA